MSNINKDKELDDLINATLGSESLKDLANDLPEANLGDKGAIGEKAKDLVNDLSEAKDLVKPNDLLEANQGDKGGNANTPTPSSTPSSTLSSDTTSTSSPEIIEVAESDPLLSTGGFRLKKSVIYIILICITIFLVYSIKVLSRVDKHIVSVDTENFYYIYSVEDNNTCTLLIPSNKLPSSMKDLIDTSEIPEGETQLLLVPGVVLTDKAKENVVITDSQLNIYGLDNTYTYEEGWGIFKHQGKEQLDSLYLYTETAKRLGLLDGELNYDIAKVDGDLATPSNLPVPEKAISPKSSNPDLSSLANKELTEEEFKELQESLAAEGFSLSEKAISEKSSSDNK